MRIKIDGTKCQGNARCWALAPELFELDDEGYLENGEIAVPPGDEQRAARAARACPERALTIVAD